MAARWLRRLGGLRAIIRHGAMITVLAGCHQRSAVVSSTADTNARVLAPVKVPDIPVPAYRTPTITLPPTTVSRAPDAGDIVRAIADSVLAQPMWRNARWGMLVVDPVSGDTLLSHDADHLFMPASNQKLLTAAIAMQLLGPDYRWRTPVLLRGVRKGTVFTGDLLLAGSGDPSWSDTLQHGDAASVFDPIVRALQQRGIARIRGRIMAVGDLLPGANTGYGWEIDDLAEAYGAPIDELLFAEGTLRVRVIGGARSGDAPRVLRAPTRSYPRVVMQARTGSGAALSERLRVQYDSTGNAVLVTGVIAAGDTAEFTLPFLHPNDAARAVLIERLESAGIRVDTAGTMTRSGDAVQPTMQARADTLVVLESAPFALILRRMQKVSQNQIAELLFRTSGRVASGDGSADSARAVAARALAAWNITSQDVAYRDGSGVSRHDYVTPRALVRVLDAMRTSSSFGIFRDALPVAGVDGTLVNRMRNTSAEGNARAKTGTIDKARSISGYVTTADGRLLLFSLLCNNYSVPTREVERVQDLIITTLASATAGK